SRAYGRSHARTARSPRAPGAGQPAAPSPHGASETRLRNPALPVTLPAHSRPAQNGHWTGLNGCSKSPFASRLLRIQLHHQVLVDVGQDLVPARRRLEHAAELLVAHLDPFGEPHLLRDVERALDAQLLARLLAHLDDVPGPHLERGDAHRLL